MIVVMVPIRTWNESNERVYWRKRADRAKKQRMGAMIMVRTTVPWRDLLVENRSVSVRLIRLSPGHVPLDDDGVVSALKAIRDGVADAFELDDKDERIRFSYAQEKAKEFSVRIEIEGRP